MNRIPDDFWNVIKSIIPKKEKHKVGRPETCNRKTLEGIFYIIKAGSPWHMLPKEFGRPTTVHGKFRKWVKSGVFDQIIKLVLKMYGDQTEDQSHYSIDASFSKAPISYEWSGKSPTDRGKQGIKKSIIVDSHGIPVSIVVGAANVHDSKFFEENIQQLHLSKDKISVLTADSAYDSRHLRKLAKNNNIALLASTNRRRNKDKNIYQPRGRWVVERTFGWLHWNRGIKTCWAKTKESFLAFLQFACSIHVFRAVGIFG